MSKITLISSDKKKFDVELDVATKSQTIKKLIENNGTSEPIVLSKVPAHILKFILIYNEHYLNS
jgi:hypothetical protein